MIPEYTGQASRYPIDREIDREHSLDSFDLEYKGKLPTILLILEYQANSLAIPLVPDYKGNLLSILDP